MARSLNFNDFPVLHLDSRDVAGSYRSWLVEFKLSVEMTCLKLGKEEVEAEQLDIFRGRIKLLALLHSIGKDGREALQSLGFDMEDGEATFDDAMTLLQSVYKAEETVYVKTMKFVTVSQTLGENENEYLLRVEKLGRNMNFGANNELREEFSLALAVNGLREPSLRTQLMQKSDLTWKDLRDTLRARHLARESEAILEGSRTGLLKVKQEVQEVTSKSKRTDRQHSSSNDSHDDSMKVNRVSSRKYRRSDRYKYSEDRRPSRDYSWSSRSSHDSSDDRYPRKGDRYGRDDREYRSSRRRSPPGRFVSPRRSASPGKEDRCYGCDEKGHLVRYCPSVRCYMCNEKGHTTKDCRLNRRGDRRDRDRGRNRSPAGVRFAGDKDNS